MEGDAAGSSRRVGGVGRREVDGGGAPRVRKSVAGLCELGLLRPLVAHSFKDHPSSGLKEVEGLRLSPQVTIMVKASCWYVIDGFPVVPLLQPRLAGLPARKQAIYLSLGRRAFCRGDWSGAKLELIDLSNVSKDGTVHARIIREEELPVITEADLNSFVGTYVEAQKLAAAIREERGPIQKRPKKSGSGTGDLFEEKP